MFKLILKPTAHQPDSRPSVLVGGSRFVAVCLVPFRLSVPANGPPSSVGFSLMKCRLPSFHLSERKKTLPEFCDSLNLELWNKENKRHAPPWLRPLRRCLRLRLEWLSSHDQTIFYWRLLSRTFSFTHRPLPAPRQGRWNMQSAYISVSWVKLTARLQHINTNAFSAVYRSSFFFFFN